MLDGVIKRGGHPDLVQVRSAFNEQDKALRQACRVLYNISLQPNSIDGAMVRGEYDVALRALNGE